MPGRTGTAMGALNPATAIASTVTVMDQHGKVVHNGGKTFFSAFKEAKEAYKQRKLEIAKERQAERRARETVMRRQHRRKSEATLSIADGDTSTAVVHRKKSKKKGGSIQEDELILEDSLVREDAAAREMMRLEDGSIVGANNAAMDMAPALFNDPSVVAVQTLLARVQSIIDELQCWTAGLSTLISELQKTPETFAAVGLSLAEISQMLTHVAPTAMIFLKSAFPTIFALISSPHFAIVAGVGTAATVIVLGGYKIVKNIMAGADENLKMAYGDVPDEAIMGGEIIGEVVEDRMIEPASVSRAETVEELPPMGIPRRSSSSRKALPQPDIQPTRWYEKDNKKDSKKEKVKKDEKSHKDDKKKKDDREKLHRSDTGKPRARRHSSSSSGVSSNRSGNTSSRDRSPPSTKQKSKEKEKEKEKDNKDSEKKKNIIKKLFDGRSA